jgi:hypothetical protein
MNFRGLGTRSLLVFALVAISCSVAFARARALLPALGTTGTRDISLDRRLDVNRFSVVVTNVGALGFDIPNLDGGAWYPRGQDLKLLFASGLWLGAEVGGEVRVAVAEYSQEFLPGQVNFGFPDNPNDPSLRVWKMTRWTGNPSDSMEVGILPPHPSVDALDHHSWTDYRAFAIPKGAPWRLYRLPDTSTPDPTDSVDVVGPDVLGDRMTWCVFNDLDPNAHHNNAGSTAPLGAEIQQTVFAFDDPGPMGDAIFIRWRIRNTGGSEWSGLRTGFWADPDIGGGLGVNDDKTGCDSTRSMGYAYNGQPVDGGYGAAPPAIGAVFLTSSPAPPGGATLGMHAFRSYINGTDPQSFTETYNSLSGLAADGSDLVDPFGQVTRYQYGGDPLAGSGWVDPSLADKRFLATSAPRFLSPGDTSEVWVALVVAPEPGVANAIAALRCRADLVRDVFASGFQRPFPPVANCAVAPNCPRPASYWRTQATGDGPYTLPDITVLASIVDQNSVALDFGADPLGGFAAVLAPGGDVRQQALREHAAFLANAWASQSALQPASGPLVTLNALIPTNCPGVPGSTTGELWTKAAEARSVSGTYQNLVTTNRRALEGVNAGFSGFGGGAGSAFDFFGSSLDPSTQPDSFPALVRVSFSHTQTQLAHRYLRLEKASDGTAPPQGRGWLYGGYVNVNFTVHDEATGDQLVAAFVERTLTDDAGVILPPASQLPSFDSTWGPTDDPTGGREYLFVFRRPYSNIPIPEFEQDGVLADGTLPGLFALWSKLRLPFDLIDDGDAFDFGFGYTFTPGSDAVLRDLAGQSLADPEVASHYQEVEDCLGGINRGETIGPTCDVPTPALASLVSAESEPGRIRVEWYLTSAGAVFVERRVDEGEWQERSAASPDGNGRVVLVDTDVLAGHRYSYRLRLTGRFAGEVSLDIPLTHRLSLAGFHPNPAVGPLSVSFSLATAAPARLEILDVAGRRVHARTLDRPAPGTQQLSLSGVRLAPGVYVIRLEQSGSRIVTRSVVLR